MFPRIFIFTLFCCVAAWSFGAQEVGTASGKGTIERIVEPATGETEWIDFYPRYAYTYSEKSTGGKKFTWIVLTEKEPPLETWAASNDREEARRSWCEQEKTPFVAVKLDADWKVDLYFLCPADGFVKTEILNTWNGLDSVALKFDVSDNERLKGTLNTGIGSCPDADGVQTYCTPTGSYTFDVPLSK